jgi:hypothetical protein
VSRSFSSELSVVHRRADYRQAKPAQSYVYTSTIDEQGFAAASTLASSIVSRASTPAPWRTIWRGGGRGRVGEVSRVDETFTSTRGRSSHSLSSMGSATTVMLQSPCSSMNCAALRMQRLLGGALGDPREASYSRAQLFEGHVLFHLNVV